MSSRYCCREHAFGRHCAHKPCGLCNELSLSPDAKIHGAVMTHELHVRIDVDLDTSTKKIKTMRVALLDQILHLREQSSWAEKVVVAITEEFERQGIQFPETHGEGLEPEDFASFIQELAARPPQ